MERIINVRTFFKDEMIVLTKSNSKEESRLDANPNGR